MTLRVEDYMYVLEQLQTQYGFTQEHAEDAIERMSQSPDVFNGFVSFLRTGNHPDLSYSGYEVNDLMMNYGLSPVGAYLMLALIAVDPTRAQGYLDDLRDDIMETVEYNPDGSIKKITFRTAGIASSETPTCPKCGKKATWVEEYKRWYCYDCKDYL